MQLAQKVWKEIGFEHGQKYKNLNLNKMGLKFGTAGQSVKGFKNRCQKSVLRGVSH